jgi:hypothetical protein
LLYTFTYLSDSNVSTASGRSCAHVGLIVMIWWNSSIEPKLFGTLGERFVVAVQDDPITGGR